MGAAMTAFAGAAQAAAATTSAAPGAAPLPLTPPPPAIVIPRFTDECPRAAGNDIVVCGRRDGDARHRVPGTPPGGDPRDAPRGPPGMQLSDGVRVEAQSMQRVRPDGWVDRRVVVRFRIAF